MFLDGGLSEAEVLVEEYGGVRMNACKRRSKMHPHRVVAAKSFGAIGTLPGAVGKAVLNALVAEEMSTGFDHSVLEPALADLTLDHLFHDRRLRRLVPSTLLLPY